MTDRQPPIDPNTLPDPDQITEEDLPAAPPRPESVGKRRFGGTHKQIRGALTFYRICAYLTGILLLALVVEMILKYGFDLELFAGGTTFDGADNTLGLHPGLRAGRSKPVIASTHRPRMDVRGLFGGLFPTVGSDALVRLDAVGDGRRRRGAIFEFLHRA